MNIILACLLLVGGLAMLWKSADLLVAGAVGLAKHFGVSPLIIGLTVVAMGTSAPEVAASIAAAIEGNGDAAIGNVYGSNIANLALVGGLVALIRPLRIKKLTLQREIPVMLIAGLILWPVLRSSYLSRPEGAVLLGVFAALIILTVYVARKDRVLAVDDGEKDGEMDSGFRGNDIKKSVLFVVIGLVGLALGAKMTVKGAVFVGGRIGISDAVIGLTIIAIGTSLPELATCVVAAIRAQHDISIGNLVGSNIFNTLLVTGTAGTIHPFALVDRRLAAGSDYWIMIGVSAAFATLAVLGRLIIGRLAGSILLCTYIAFMIYLFLLSR